MANVSIPDLVIYELNFFLAFLIIFKWSHVHVCKNQCLRDWGFLEGLSRLGLMFFLKWTTHLRNVFKSQKTRQFWGPCPIFFWRSVLGFGLNGSKLYIIHWFQCQGKVGSRPVMEHSKESSPRLKSDGGRNVNTYSIIIQCISHNILKFVPYQGDIGSPKIYNSNMYIYICIIRENYSGNSFKEGIFFWQIFDTLQCFW